MTRARALETGNTAVRERRRSDGVSPATPEMLALAEETFEANARKNKASREEANAKKKLHKAMLQSNVRHFNFDGEFEGAVTPAEAVIAEDTVEVLDVHKLKALLDEETFMQVISATKTAVEKFAGEDVVMQASVPLVKPASLKVRKRA